MSAVLNFGLLFGAGVICTEGSFEHGMIQVPFHWKGSGPHSPIGKTMSGQIISMKVSMSGGCAFRSPSPVAQAYDLTEAMTFQQRSKGWCVNTHTRCGMAILPRTGFSTLPVTVCLGKLCLLQYYLIDSDVCFSRS